MFSRSFKEKKLWYFAAKWKWRLEGKAKAKATKICPRAVLEDEDNPRGPHPWLDLSRFTQISTG